MVDGNSDLWAKAYILLFVETWETSATVLEFPGFVHLTSLWNPKQFLRGRGYGGIAVWVRSTITTMVTVEYADARKQFLCLRLSSHWEPAFLVVAYFAPRGSPVYANLDSDPFLDITRVILRLRDEGAVWILGDFNSRVGVKQGLDLPDTGVSFKTEDTCWQRISEDGERNGMTDAFLQFLAACDLTIVNGTGNFPLTHYFTCITANGASVIDFLLGTRAARDRIFSFVIEPLYPESDHRPLSCSISGFRRGSIQAHRTVRGSLLVHSSKRGAYERVVESKLKSAADHLDIVNTVQLAAKEVFWCPNKGTDMEEVSEALRSLDAGKASDFDGLTVEMVRWGGPTLLSCVTRLNQASSQGLFPEWACGSLVQKRAEN
ncbi:hypothetical protein R1sor_027205 [Riccia sorocarpa]|uniref:Endonuclease/exonuclease/phosphatase domain-containing protein n=1 Tax=Riccia sorocarpa TaxID=122646 RepID=A0ABD3GGF3_9MARC